MSGSFGRPMKGSRTPTKPSRLIASSAKRSTVGLTIAVPRRRFGCARQRRQDVVVVVAPRACRRDHRALDAVLVERRDQLLVGEAVFRRVARIVDQRHVGGEDMHMGVDLEAVGHGDCQWPVQCGSRPAFLTTAAHMSMSDFSRASSSSGEPATGSPPSSSMRLLKVRVGDDGADVAVEHGDDLLRRAGRRDQRIPAVDRGVDAAFPQRRHVRLHRRTLAAARRRSRGSAWRRSAISARHRTRCRSGCRRASSEVSTSAEVRCGTMVIGMPVAERNSSRGDVLRAAGIDGADVELLPDRRARRPARP